MNPKKLLIAISNLLELRNKKLENDATLPSSLNDDVTKVQFYRPASASMNNKC